MYNRGIRFLAFGLGFLLLFHGLDKIIYGTEYIEKLILDMYIPDVEEEVPFGMWVTPFMPSMIFIGKMFIGSAFITSLEDIETISHGVYITELIAPLFLIFGKYIRLAALLITFHMLVVIFLAFRTTLFTLNAMGAWNIETPLLYLLATLTLLFLKKDCDVLQKKAINSTNKAKKKIKKRVKKR
jgi:uncharacterized membrane protein YphA (DoxX/SURF4 family)